MGASRVVGYVRVSTEEQAIGPVAQRAALEAWCSAQGAELVAVHEDIGVSGGAPLDKRPGLLAAVAALREHGAVVLLVAKRDRLARDTLAAAMVERMAERAKARILTADGSCNADGPEGLLMRRMVDAFAEYERAMIGARTRMALAVKRSRGEKTGGAVPYGYRLSADGVHLEADEIEQQVVALARKHRAEGLSLREIGARLEKRGMVPRSGGAWQAMTLARIAKAAKVA